MRFPVSTYPGRLTPRSPSLLFSVAPRLPSLIPLAHSSSDRYFVFHSWTPCIFSPFYFLPDLSVVSFPPLLQRFLKALLLSTRLCCKLRFPVPPNWSEAPTSCPGMRGFASGLPPFFTFPMRGFPLMSMPFFLESRSALFKIFIHRNIVATVLQCQFL